MFGWFDRIGQLTHARSVILNLRDKLEKAENEIEALRVSRDRYDAWKAEIEARMQSEKLQYMIEVCQKGVEVNDEKNTKLVNMMEGRLQALERLLNNSALQEKNIIVPSNCTHSCPLGSACPRHRKQNDD